MNSFGQNKVSGTNKKVCKYGFAWNIFSNTEHRYCNLQYFYSNLIGRNFTNKLWKYLLVKLLFQISRWQKVGCLFSSRFLPCIHKKPLKFQIVAVTQLKEISVPVPIFALFHWEQWVMRNWILVVLVH